MYIFPSAVVVDIDFMHVSVISAEHGLNIFGAACGCPRLLVMASGKFPKVSGFNSLALSCGVEIDRTIKEIIIDFAKIFLEMKDCLGFTVIT
jgi:hypothetical protein